MMCHTYIALDIRMRITDIFLVTILKCNSILITDICFPQIKFTKHKRTKLHYENHRTFALDE